VALMLVEELPDPPSRSARTMADTEPGASGQPPSLRAAQGDDRDKPEAFDIWLQRGLHQLYDSVAKEPVPEELLKLIEQDRSDRAK
jgi:hypothetical protein